MGLAENFRSVWNRGTLVSTRLHFSFLFFSFLFLSFPFLSFPFLSFPRGGGCYWEGRADEERRERRERAFGCLFGIIGLPS